MQVSATPGGWEGGNSARTLCIGDFPMRSDITRPAAIMASTSRQRGPARAHEFRHGADGFKLPIVRKCRNRVPAPDGRDFARAGMGRLG